MIKRIITLIFSSLLFFSCTNWYSLPEAIKKQGQIIENYPIWATEGYRNTGISEWKDWQSEDTKNLRDLVPDDLIFNQEEKVKDYTGKYRINIGAQTVYLEFDNGYGCGLFYLFVRELTKENYNEKYYVPQEKENEFIYNGIAKYGYYGNNAGKFYCKMIQGTEEGKKKYFSYLLKIDDKDIINENFYVYTNYEKSNNYDWLEKDYFDKKGNLKYYISNYKENTLSFHNEPVANDPLEYSYVFTGSNKFHLYPCPPYHGGMKEINVDEVNKTVEYQLFDGSPKAENFLEIKINEDGKEADWTWFDKDLEGNRINQREEKLYTYIIE